MIGSSIAPGPKRGGVAAYRQGRLHVDPARMLRQLAEALSAGQPPELARRRCAPGSHDVIGTQPERVRAAVATCAGCPALAACSAWAEALPQRQRRAVVLGGVVYDRDGRPMAGEDRWVA